LLACLLELCYVIDYLVLILLLPRTYTKLLQNCFSVFDKKWDYSLSSIFLWCAFISACTKEWFLIHSYLVKNSVLYMRWFVQCRICILIFFTKNTRSCTLVIQKNTEKYKMGQEFSHIMFIYNTLYKIKYHSQTINIHICKNEYNVVITSTSTCMWYQSYLGFEKETYQGVVMVRSTWAPPVQWEGRVCFAAGIVRRNTWAPPVPKLFRVCFQREIREHGRREWEGRVIVWVEKKENKSAFVEMA
jgi:hypothetical protein